MVKKKTQGNTELQHIGAWFLLFLSKHGRLKAATAATTPLAFLLRLAFRACFGWRVAVLRKKLLLLRGEEKGAVAISALNVCVTRAHTATPEARRGRPTTATTTKTKFASSRCACALVSAKADGRATKAAGAGGPGPASQLALQLLNLLLKLLDLSLE